MRYVVDLTRCENHGQCTFSAPTHFELNDAGQLALRDVAELTYESNDVPTTDEASVEEAADMCPVQAINLLP